MDCEVALRPCACGAVHAADVPSHVPAPSAPPCRLVTPIPLSPFPVTPPHCGALTSLSLDGCRQLSERALCGLCAAAPRLVVLGLGGTAASDMTVEAAATHLSLLRALSLNSCPVTAAMLPLLLLGCASLAALHLARCPHLDMLTFHHSS